MHSQMMADTGNTSLENFTGTIVVAANFISATIPLGTAPLGTVTVTPCSAAQNFPPFSSNETTLMSSLTRPMLDGGLLSKKGCV